MTEQSGFKARRRLRLKLLPKWRERRKGPGVRPPSGQGLIRRGVPAAQLAKAELNPRVSNVIIFGAIVSLIEVLPLEHVKAALEEKFAENSVNGLSCGS